MRVEKVGFYRTRNGQTAEVTLVAMTEVGCAVFGHIGIVGTSWNETGKNEDERDNDLVKYLGHMVALPEPKPSLRVVNPQHEE